MLMRCTSKNVIFNLLDNAVKYRKPDTPLDVFLKTWNEEDAIMLSIRDTGLGIKRDNLKKNIPLNQPPLPLYISFLLYALHVE